MAYDLGNSFLAVGSQITAQFSTVNLERYKIVSLPVQYDYNESGLAR